MNKTALQSTAQQIAAMAMHHPFRVAWFLAVRSGDLDKKGYSDMSKLNGFGFRSEVNQSRKAAIVGETVLLRRDDQIPINSVTVVHQPSGADVQLVRDSRGIGFESSTLTHPGVYHFEVNEGHVTGHAFVMCWPAEILHHLSFTHTECAAPRSDGEREELARRVLHNIANAENLAMADDLFVGHWFPAQLCGGKPGEGLSLQPFGAR